MEANSEAPRVGGPEMAELNRRARRSCVLHAASPSSGYQLSGSPMPLTLRHTQRRIGAQALPQLQRQDAARARTLPGVAYRCLLRATREVQRGSLRCACSEMRHLLQRPRVVCQLQRRGAKRRIGPIRVPLMREEATTTYVGETQYFRAPAFFEQASGHGGRIGNLIRRRGEMLRDVHLLLNQLL